MSVKDNTSGQDYSKWGVPIIINGAPVDPSQNWKGSYSQANGFRRYNWDGGPWTNSYVYINVPLDITDCDYIMLDLYKYANCSAGGGSASGWTSIASAPNSLSNQKSIAGGNRGLCFFNVKNYPSNTAYIAIGASGTNDRCNVYTDIYNITLIKEQDLYTLDPVMLDNFMKTKGYA